VQKQKNKKVIIYSRPDLVSGVLNAFAQKCWVVDVFADPRQTGTAAIQEHVLTPRVSVIVTEDEWTSTDRLLQILHQTLGVVDGRMSLDARVEPAPVQILCHQGTTVTASTYSTKQFHSAYCVLYFTAWDDNYP